MEKIENKEVKYARLRIMGLRRAIDHEQNNTVMLAMLNHLREEEDRLSDYELTGVYERD